MITSCGKGCRWKQAGNQTSHCGQCHRTFDSLRAFDAHQTVGEERMDCHDPAGLRKRNGMAAMLSRHDEVTTYWRLPQ